MADFNDVKKVYYDDGDWKMKRGKNFKIHFKDIVEGDPKDERQANRMIAVDGEAWEY